MTTRAPRVDFIASIDTDVPVSKSVAAIHELVQRFGAGSFGVTYARETGEPEAVRFTLRDPNATGGGDDPTDLTVELRAPSTRLERVFRDRAKRLMDSATIRDKAARTAWRHLHDFVRATLIAVQDGLLTPGEAFLPHLVIIRPDGSEVRFGDALASAGLLQSGPGGRLLLGSGPSQ